MTLNHLKLPKSEENITQIWFRRSKAPIIELQHLILIGNSTWYRSAYRENIRQNNFSAANHQRPSLSEGNINQKWSRCLKLPKINFQNLILIGTSTRYRNANRNDFSQNHFLVPNHQQLSQQQGNIIQRWPRHLKVPKIELQNLILIGTSTRYRI